MTTYGNLKSEIDNSPVLPMFQSITNNISAGGDSDEMLVLTTPLTNDQIIHLPSTGISVLTGVTAKIAVPVIALIEFDWTADYGNINNAATLAIKDLGSNDYVFLPLVNSVDAGLDELSDFLMWGGDAHVLLPAYHVVNSIETPASQLSPSSHTYDTLSIGTGWEISIQGNVGNLSGGDPLNTMTVTIYYALK